MTASIAVQAPTPLLGDRPVICASSLAINSATMTMASRDTAEHAGHADHALQATRQRLMRACSSATPGEIADLVSKLGALPLAIDLRKPEVGLVMLRGRIGGDGAVFNVGEATVSRAAVRSATGAIGFGMRLGRSVEAARSAAILDALLQSIEWKDRIIANLLHPLEQRQQQRRTCRVEEAAATRVEFFTMSRGSE